MGNTMEVMPTYIAQIKTGHGEKIYLMCPDHMPLRMDTMHENIKMCPKVGNIKVYAFYLQKNVSYTQAPLQASDIKTYKREAEKVVNMTHILCERDVEILNARVTDLLEEDQHSEGSSNQSSLTKIDMDPIVDFEIQNITNL